MLSGRHIGSLCCLQAFNRQLDVHGQTHVDEVSHAVQHALKLSSTALFHRTELPLTGTSWQVAVNTMLTLLDNVLADPSAHKPRVINPNNPALHRRLGSLTLPTAHALAVRALPGLDMLTAAGWLANSSAALELPAVASIVGLAARATELRSVLSLLQSAADLEASAVAANMTAAASKSVTIQGAPDVLNQLKAALQQGQGAEAKSELPTSVPSGKSGDKPQRTAETKVSAQASTTKSRIPVPKLPLKSAVAPAPPAEQTTVNDRLVKSTEVALSMLGPRVSAKLLSDAEAQLQAQREQMEALQLQV